MPIPSALARLAVAVLAASIAPAALAQPDFGDNASQWADDGECDDPRFEGSGSAETLLEEDRGHDANDCRALFQVGRVRLRGAAAAPPAPTGPIDFGDDTSRWARDGECDDPRFEGDGAANTLLAADLYHDATDCQALFAAGRIALREDAGPDAARVQRGRLEKGDGTLASGEYADHFTFSGTAGQRALVDLRSSDFDPYLLVRSPSGEQFDNDDFEGDASRSLLSLELTETGDYRVTVTSYEEGETGGYTLSIDVGANPGLTARLDRSGRLESGDATLSSGEYVDSFEFDGMPGQHVVIDLRSSAFDTYLILKDPAGEQTENDDADDGGVGHSVIETDLTEPGTYVVLVTSYESGETGAYTLSIDPTAHTGRTPASRDITTLTVGQPAAGELRDGDAAFQDGEYHDTYVFDGTAGESMRVELASAEFDTYLGLVTPSGEEIANDDFAGDTTRSVIELALPETGRYRVQATSYGAEETGAYSLLLARASAAVPVERRSRGRVYGLFAGISDYPDGIGDLAYTAEDATRIRDALIRGGGMRAEDALTLVESEATIGNLSRASGFESTDPDGLDETITLYDGICATTSCGRTLPRGSRASSAPAATSPRFSTRRSRKV